MIKFISSKVELVDFKANEIGGKSFKVPAEFSRGFEKISESSYSLKLIVDIRSTDEFNFPFDLHCETATVFQCVDEDEVSIKNYLDDEGTSIAYSFIRNVISNITASTLVQPLLLPQIDIASKFNEVFRNIKD